MKFNTLRYLILPWFVFFCVIIAMMIVNSTVYKFPAEVEQYYLALIGGGVFLCLMYNFRTLTKAGIWLAHPLPNSLRNNPWSWFIRAVLAIAFAYGVYEVGNLSWTPIIWQGAVIPVVFMICLFIAIRSVMGPLLVFCSRIAFSRFFAFILSWPVFILVPITAIFLGRTIVNAYQVSRPDFAFKAEAPAEITPDATTTKEGANDEAAETIEATSQSALELQEAVASGKSCEDKGKLISKSLSPTEAADTTFWAIKALKCDDMKSVIALHKLSEVMLKHPNPVVRASAITQMTHYGIDKVKPLGYLLVKRISENEPLPVIEAASLVMMKLGDDERAWVSKRLTNLLENPKTSALASKILVSKFKREDLVTEFVTTNLTLESARKDHAISMICSLSKNSRKLAEPHIDVILSSIKTGDTKDPAVKALECLGPIGLASLRKEIETPQKVEKTVAARAFAEAAWSDEKVVLDTASKCVRDTSPNVREWCSQALGKAGAPAIPSIMNLLQSNDADLKRAATHALSFFDDTTARQELLRERAKNSGWMANKRNLEVARAIDQALINMN